MCLQRLKDLRNDRELTQAEVGKILKIRQNVYSRYETGDLSLLIEYLVILADFYKISADYILGRTNNAGPLKEIDIVKIDLEIFCNFSF